MFPVLDLDPVIAPATAVGALAMLAVPFTEDTRSASLVPLNCCVTSLTQEHRRLAARFT
jgi:hypothetical protein